MKTSRIDHRALAATGLRAALAALALSAGIGHAQPGPGPGSGPPPTPPAEALAACKSLAAGKACSFSAPSGAVQGSCWAPEGKPLACRPTGAGGPAGAPPGGTPPTANK